MTTAAQTVIKNAALILQDIGSVRWTISDLVGYLNAGELEIAIYRPDVFAVTSTLTLVAGIRQSLPAGGTKLLNVVRNMNGNLRAVRIVAQALLDAQVPSWSSQAAGSEIIHYMYDERTPRVFYVYPPASTSNQVEIVYGAVPATPITDPGSGDYTAVSGNVNVPDQFVNALGDYILYKAFTKDADFAANATRAVAYYTAFANAIGIEVKATGAVAPPGSQPAAAAA